MASKALETIWIRDTVYTEKEICKLVGYEESELISAIAIGYPDETPSQRPRKSYDEIVINIC